MPLKLLLAIDFQTKSSYILPMIKLSYELKNILEYMAIGIRFKSIELLGYFSKFFINPRKHNQNKLNNYSKYIPKLYIIIAG